MSSPDVWAAFSQDPRDPGNESMRASDQDRAVVQQVLTEAYADGRLDREEFDQRSGQAAAARTLGELPPLIKDLVVLTGARSPALRNTDLVAQAERAYGSDRREALLGFLGPSMVCVVIWLVTSWPGLGFFWPAFVIAGTGINLLRTLVRRQDIIDEHVRKLEEKRIKELRSRPPEDGDEHGDEHGDEGAQ